MIRGFVPHGGGPTHVPPKGLRENAFMSNPKTDMAKKGGADRME